MDFEPPTLEDLSDLAEEHLGLRYDRDGAAMRQLAAIGLTVQAWRNTSLEDLHAGDHPSGGFPDADMMRFNIATFRVVAGHVEADRLDWEALIAALTDPARELPGGITVGELAGDEFAALAADSRRALEIDRNIEADQGFLYVVLFLGLQGGMSNRGWYGTPWWEDIVELFGELIADPASSAWKYDDGKSPPPRQAADWSTLEAILLEKPEALDDDAIYWCLRHGLPYQATLGGFARWRKRRDPDWSDPWPWLEET